MKKTWMLVILTCFFCTLVACGPEKETTTEVLDFSTFTEVYVDQSEISTIYKIADIQLTKDNLIYIVIYEDIYKGTFIGIDEGNTIFSIEVEIGFFEWYDAMEDEAFHAYYK
ncbi:MAG: hypothetical protein JEZ05_03605 [Tenericutes bacterium]|nr:hypothetical protein [Mycoplasmatota bacterium]